MKTLIVIAAMIWTMAFSPLTGTSLAQKTETEIPFTVEKGHIIVVAKIKKDVPVEMALATGAEFSLIGPENLKKYKLSVRVTGEGIITGRNDKTIDFVSVPDIRVGEVETSGMNFRLGQESVNVIKKSVGRDIFGVLGADFFKGRTVQFDFKQKVVRFLSGWKAPKEGSQSVAILPMVQDDDRPTKRLPIIDRITLNGKSIKTLLDVGSITVISLTPLGAKEAGLPIPPEKSEPQPATVSLAIDKLSFTGVPAVVHAKGSHFDNLSSGYSAMIGIAVLQNFIATFDFDGAVIVLERP